MRRQKLFRTSTLKFRQSSGVDTNILDPRDTYADASRMDEKAKDLAEDLLKLCKYESNEAGKALVSAIWCSYKSFSLIKENHIQQRI